MSDNAVHCWKDYRDWVKETYGLLSGEYIDSFNEWPATCMLPAGHAGPHEWTPDSETAIKFLPKPEPSGNPG